MITLELLKQKRDAFLKDQQNLVEYWKAQMNKFDGAIAVLNDLIAEMEKAEQEKPQ